MFIYSLLCACTHPCIGVLDHTASMSDMQGKWITPTGIDDSCFLNISTASNFAHVSKNEKFIKCPSCGGFFPWVSWERFFFANLVPGNGGDANCVSRITIHPFLLPLRRTAAAKGTIIHLLQDPIKTKRDVNRQDGVKKVTQEWPKTADCICACHASFSMTLSLTVCSSLYLRVTSRIRSLLTNLP